MMFVQNSKDLGQETMRTGTTVGVNVQHNDGVLDSDGGGTSRSYKGFEVGRRAASRDFGLERPLYAFDFWKDNCSSASGIDDILNADRNLFSNDLFHGELWAVSISDLLNPE